jgi:hypothetical protein
MGRHATVKPIEPAERIHMEIFARTFMMVCLLNLTACGGHSPVIQSEPSKINTPVDGAAVTLSGRLNEGGEATGKSIAAWQGFAVGERFFILTLDPNQVPNVDAVMIHDATTDSLESWVGKRVQIKGTWRVRKPVVQNPMEPRQMPVNLESGSMEVIQPKPTLNALSVVALPMP